ncbi:MAG: primosomal protein N' [Pseudomonadota bacterium]
MARNYPGGTPLSVLTTQPLDGPLDYLAPEGGAALGAFVKVPLGPRQVLGVIWGEAQGDYPVEKLRPITAVVDVPPMRADMQDFLMKTGAYTLTPLYQMLRMTMRVPGLADPPGDRTVYQKGSSAPDRMTDARARVIDVLEEDPDKLYYPKELADMAGVSASVVKGLADQGVLLPRSAPRDAPYTKLDPSRPGKTLSDSQKDAVDALRAKSDQRFSCTLLQGVTGSGKTEVYLEAVAECLARGQQALVLLPEIALTVDFLDRVEARFGARPAEWHYGVTMTERRRCWRMVAQNGAQLVVGARSALYLPFANLGLIVVDEEHDSSYKQEDGVFYSARDMAVMRASIAGAQVILASATPALETWVNAEAGKYDRVVLDRRFGAAELPEMVPLDLREEEMSAQSWISPRLAQEIDRRLEAGEQSLLFLNRRGYAPITVCRVCGYQVGCDHCDARMVEHRFRGELMCHQCGETKDKPKTCPSCGIEDRFAPIGPGVERLAEEATARFPEARIALLSSDLMLSGQRLREHIKSIAEGEADVIIGTQLVAKGHNFPLLTCVGVIDADLGLQGGDLRAAERTFQLIRQVAGRAGRADRRGTAYIQTHQPEHPVIKAIISGEEEAFWRAEAEARRSAGVPPFGRLAGVVISGQNLSQVQGVAQAMARSAGPLHAIGAEVFGPAPAPIARIRGRHRMRLLVRSAKDPRLQGALSLWRDGVTIPSQVRVSIDIDPQSFY